MGDGERVPVRGYGTARIKVDGYVIILKNALHIPELESNLFSATRHGSNGDGCAFLITKGVMSLSFPDFTINQEVPLDGDLRIKLQPLNKTDWHFSCPYGGYGVGGTLAVPSQSE